MLGAGQRVTTARKSLTDGSTAPYGPKSTPGTVWARSLTERQFQALLVEGLRQRLFTVWMVPNMRLTTAGLPDVLAWTPRLPGLLFCFELKREHDARVTPAQRAALAHLASVEGIVARIVRPSEWPNLRDTIDAMLAAREVSGE